jgi:hypothetical protein
MQTFTDSLHRTWDVCVTCASAKRARDLAGVDILDITGGSLERLERDIIAVGEVLHAICGPQRPGVALDEFLAALHGDSAHAARQALIDEIVSFTPDPSLRAALARVVTQARAEAQARTAALTMDGSSSGDAPASSASTLDH